MAEVISEAGGRQLHVAETEKYAHVTYFFNGGREAEWNGEERRLVDSPRDVPTYDHKPEMSAAKAADAFCSAWAEGGYRFGIINFANPDMVGHTGSIPAAVSAIEAVDACLARVVATVHASGGACIVTADHGNADHMLEPDGSPNTAHTTNPVPLIVTVPGLDAARGDPRRRRADRPRAARDRAAGRDDRDLAPGPIGRASGEARAMRTDPDRLSFEIDARDGDARAGCSTTAHGPVETPGFVPLATEGSVKGLLPGEVAGHRLRDGPRQHLPPDAGARGRADRRAPAASTSSWAGTGDHHRLRRFPGLFARPRRRRRRDQGPARPRRRSRAACSAIGEEGVRFRSYIDGSEHFLSPERSMEVQAQLGSDIALVFDECTPFHADRDYTARSTERTHRWLERCLDWHAEQRARRARPSSGSSRAAPTRTCGASRPRRSPPPASTGSRSAARSARTRRRCARSSG